jgi:hypothetical protein
MSDNADNTDLHNIKDMIEIKSTWQLYSDDEKTNDLLKTKRLPNLESWTTWPGMDDFTGTITYETDVELDHVRSKNIMLDLGTVYEQAHVHINGKDCGYRLWAPYIFDISGVLRQGTNTIQIEVTNTMANRLERAKLPSGLIGPVVLCTNIANYAPG